MAADRTDPPFADLRVRHDAWVLAQDEQGWRDWLAALAEGSADGRVFFRGYQRGVAARLGMALPTEIRAERRRRELVAHDPSDRGDDHGFLLALAPPPTFRAFQRGFVAGYGAGDAGRRRGRIPGA